MCNTCGYSICQCNQSYNYNWYNTEGLPCTTCSGTVVCKKKVPSACITYTVANLDALDLSAPTDLQAITSAVNTAIGNLQIVDQQQGLTNAAILEILNDINDRLNALESGADHDPYTL